MLLLALPLTFAGVVASNAFSGQILIISDALSISLASIAAVVCYRTSQGFPGRPRLAWLTISLGLFLWAVGELIWGFYEVVLEIETPFPSSADFLYLTAYPVLFVGILMLSASPRETAFLRTLLDAGVVVLALTAPLWVYLLQPIYATSASSWLEKVISMAYPIADLMLVFALTVATLRAGAGRQGVILTTFGVGLIFFVATDLLFAIASVEDGFSTGSLLDMGWMLGYSLIAVAAVLEARWQPTHGARKNDDARPASAQRQVIPIAILFALVAWYCYQSVAGEGADLVTAICMVLAAFLIVCRSFLSLNDVLTVSRQLNATSDLLAEANKALRERSRTLNTLLADAVELSRRDSLTGLFNHGAILAELEYTLQRREPVLVAMLDVDYMKNINDSLGHPVGDEILKAIAASLTELQMFTAGRYGGDEFIAFASPDISEFADARGLLEKKISTINIDANQDSDATVSLGWSSFPADGVSVLELIDVADKRLYETKGRRATNLKPPQINVA